MDYLSIDIGGSSLKYAVMDEEFTLKKQSKVPSDSISNQKDMIEAIRKIYMECGEPEGGIALSYCGELNSETGYLYSGGSYPYMAHTNFKEDVERACGTVVNIENDGNCAAIAEVEKGSLTDVCDAYVAVIGTGIAGALVLDRQIRRGSHSYTGFLTMTVKHIDEDFSVENLAVAATSANYLGSTYECAMNLERKTIDGKAFFEIANGGDETAIDILRSYCRNLANMMYNIHLTVDVEAIAVGGGISTQPLFQIMIMEAFDNIYLTTPIQSLQVPKPKFLICKYCNNANLIGALCHHLAKTGKE